VGSTVLSPDGKILAVPSRDGFRFLDVPTGRELRRTTQQALNANNFVFSPEGKYLAGSAFNGPIQLWEVATGNPARQFQPAGAQRNRSGVLAFSANAAVLAVTAESPGGQTNGTAYAWDVATGKSLCQVELVHNQQLCLALSPDGTILATSGMSMNRSPGGARDPELAFTIQLWDTGTGKELRRLRTQDPNVRRIAFSPDGKTLAVIAALGELAFLDVATGKELDRLAGQRGMAASLSFSRDGRLLAAVSHQGGIALWEGPVWKRVAVAEGPRCRCSSLAFAAGGKVLACGIDSQAIRLWEARSGERLSPDGGHAAPVTWLAFEDKGRLRSASQDGKVIEWDLARGEEVRQFELPDEENAQRVGMPVQSVRASSADGKYLLTAAANLGQLALRDAGTGRVLCEFTGGQGNPLGTSAALSPDGTLLAIVSQDRSAGTPGVALWETGSGRLRSRWKLDQQQQLRALAFAPDGKTLAVASSSQRGAGPSEIHLWEVLTGKERSSIKGPTMDAWSLAFSPDGKLLAAGGIRGSVGLYDAKGREAGQFVTGMKGPFPLLLFSPDGRTLAVGQGGQPNDQARVQLWEVASASLRCEWTGHRGTISALAFSPDGKLLASGSGDTTILVHDATGLRTAPTVSSAPLSEEDLQQLWASLDAHDGQAAHKILLQLSADPKAAITYLGKQLLAAQPKAPTPSQIARLIADLDSEEYAVREKATAELAASGKAAEKALRKLLAGDPAPEARRRAQELIERLETPGPSPAELRAIRAVELLEWLGTLDARAVLGTLAKERHESVAGEEAQGALDRLKH
jgi:WD40 repeat protein